MSRDMSRRPRRSVQPKFFVFLGVLLAVIGGAVFGVLKLREKPKEILTVEATPVPTIPVMVTPTPAPDLPEGLRVNASSAANPTLFGFSYTIQAKGDEVSFYNRQPAISFKSGRDYTKAKGILTFGGNNYRNSFSYGTLNLEENLLRRAWEQTVGSIGNWGGTGWTGEPLIIQWDDEIRPFLGIGDQFKEMADFTEVIYPAMDGKIYFFELTSGTKTRNPIDLGVVVKSTPCLDPNGWPILYVGQSIQSMNEKNLSVAYVHAISLIDNTEICRFGGHDYFSDRDWQAYDSSPIITDDTLIYAGENGVIYTSRLNTQYDAETGTVTLNPERLVKYKYTGTGYTEKNMPGTKWLGVESSISGFRNYIFFADNGGRLQCVDLNTMSLVYVNDLNEDADATVVIDESYPDNTIYLYAASQVQNAVIEGEYGYTHHRCFNGLTGELVWDQKLIASAGDENSSGGTIATPQVGRGNVSDLVFYSTNLTALNSVSAVEADSSESEGEESQQRTESKYILGGKIIAYNKHTGDVKWTVEQSSDYWSSPVLVYNEAGKGYLIQCDRDGFLKIYDALTGSELASISLGSRIDSTPSVFNNYLVVGTRGKGGAGEAAKIICVKIG